MKKQKIRGFTLVELLVVIAIIGILVALLIPAVNMATGIARRNSCMQNQRQWGLAMISHATDKEYFPGRVSTVGTQDPNIGNVLRLANLKPGHIPVSWQTKLLPYVEQQNTYDAILKYPQIFLTNGDRAQTLDAKNIQLGIAICPSDPPQSDVPSRTSYVANTGVWDQEFFENGVHDLTANGICHNLALPNTQNSRVSISYVSTNDGTANTLLLSENVNALTWHLTSYASLLYTNEEPTHGMLWPSKRWAIDPANYNRSDHDSLLAINKGHTLVQDSQLLSEVNGGNGVVGFGRPSSYHNGGVNAFFCDNHAMFLSEEIDWTVYKRLLTPKDTEARHGHMTVGGRYMTEQEIINDNRFGPKFIAPLSDADLEP